jgi:hypothetical protein
MQKELSTTGSVLLAGVVGGTAEVAWVVLFCLMSPLQSSLVAEEIARSFLPQIAGFSAVMIGLIIHYVLSMLIAGIFAITILPMLTNRIDVPAVLLASGAVLVGIWAINFFITLPMINPDFVTLMPYTVTLLSKLGFGITMGWVFVVRRAALAGQTRDTVLTDYRECVALPIGNTMAR